ncbi:restriction endonuclease subunit S [Variovorax paradoxus]|nr:restriction endonuclease subunit S [Variovorax paradoxus]
MMPAARTALLGEVCDINPRLPKSHGLQDDCEVGFVPMAAVNEASGTIEQRLTRRFAEVKKGYTHFAEDDVLFAKITPCMENGKAAIARGLAGGKGFGSTEFHVLRAKESVLPEWLYYFVRQERFRREARRSFTGTAGQQRVPAAFMAGTAIPVPALAEQRRIVDALSCAESIVRLRREARKKTELLVLAIHADMFGDTATNPKGWAMAPLDEVLAGIDGGRSPRCHNRPKAPGEWGVLRLSALKHAAYDESAHKTLPATEVPDARHEVRQGDLLLSRKNTPELVGTPAYVWATQGRILLPDLIFRLRLRPESGVHPLYLWALLTAPAMRRRLRLMASGTAASMPNISKERLRTLSIMVPPPARQQAFADHATALRSISLQQQAALASAEATFEALLARTFGT